MRQKALGLFVAVLAAVALVSTSGAATTKAQKTTRIDVSTRAAVIHYLHSIHVKAKGAVIQRGLRNYAGARCPGKHWNCARTKHTVVQITGHGGNNRFACTRSHCAVVQISGVSRGVYFSGRQLAAKGGGGGGNSAVCVKTTGLTQSCSISQIGAGPNTAGVYQNAGKQSGLTQSAVYTASITQQGSGPNPANPTQPNVPAAVNTACVTQFISIDGSTTAARGKPVTVTLKAHQSVVIKQDVVPNGSGNASGDNRAEQGATSTGSCASGSVLPSSVQNATAALTQSQVLSSTANGTAAITQNENRSDSTLTDTTTVPCGASDPADTANICIDIEQNQGNGHGVATGKNNAVFWQENNLQAIGNTASGGSVTQTQGAEDPAVGGLVGTINQDSHGKSTFTSTQNETQCEDALSRSTIPIPNTGTGAVTCDTGGDLDPPDGVNVTQTQYGPAGVGYRPTKQRGRIHYQKVTKDPSDSSQTGNATDSFLITQKSTQDNDKNTKQNNHVVGGLSTPGSGTVNQNVVIQGKTKVDVQTGGGTNFQGFITCSGSFLNTCTKTLSAPVIDSQPNDPSFASDSADFTFSNADPTVDFLCSLNGADYSACDPGAGPGSGSQSYGPLAAGSYTFSVVTQDADRPLDISSPSTVSWTVLPLSVDALGGDGSAAGWACQPGGPIGLTLGTDTGNTFAEIDLTDAAGTALDTLQEPTFTTDNYAAGSPRYYITLDNGDSLWGYPPNSNLNGADFAWAINNGNTYLPWGIVQGAESGATVTGASVIADGDQAAGVTDKIGDLQFDGTTFNSGTCSP